jgi:arylsulfatase/arylsulfatase A
MVTNIDRNVGRLFQKLDELGIRENTLVIFMVDNGPNGRRYVAGMRGMKSQVHEGGIRAPFFVDWPARLKAGTESDRVAAHIDVLPTLLAAAEAKVPSELKLDGRNLLPLLEGRAGDWTDREIVIQSHRGDVPVKFHNFMIRNQTWKLVHPSGFGKESFTGPPQFEFYNLANDPLELHDVASQHPTELAALKSQYAAWFDDVSKTRTENFAPPRIHIGTAHENPTVLTRQDWRHTHERPWSRNSRGHWLLYAATRGNYDVECRFAAGGEDEEVRLTINSFSQTVKVRGGDAAVTLKGVPIADGNLKLEVTLVNGETSRGVHQVELLRQ